MADINSMAGGELTQHLNNLTGQKAELRKEYQKALKEASDATAKAKILKVKIAQVSDDIAACKYNIKMEGNTV